MRIYRPLILLVIAAVMASCGGRRSPLQYFTDIESIQSMPIGDYKVKIQPSDELLITVSSATPEATAIYNVPLVNPASNANLQVSTQPKLQTYVVDSKGDIDFPILGKIHVAGLDLEQVKDLITAKISKDVEDPLVKVELVNFSVNVAGEVKEPGRYPITGTRFSVLDALSAAGDLTPYGERDNVLIIREENGVRTMARLDLNKAESLTSPYFFIRQNDYVYVEPSATREDNAEYNQNNAFKVSIVSAIVSGCSVLTSIFIALYK